MPPLRQAGGTTLTDTHTVPYQLRSHTRLAAAVNGDNDNDDGSVEGQNPRTDGDQQVENLPKATIRLLKASFLVDMIDQEDLELDPAYQRGVVWSDEAQGSFISSLLMNVQPPMIYLNKVAPGSGEGPADAIYACIDGKQRLTSLHRFFNGEIPCKHEGEQLWAFDNATQPTDASGRSASKLTMPDEIQEQLKDIKFACAVYPQLTRAQEILLFQRLQFGKQLTVAERVRAQEGPWETLAKHFEVDYRVVVGLVRTRRATGFRAILQSFIQIMECRSFTGERDTPDAKFSMKAIESFCANQDSLTSDSRRHLEAVFQLFTQLASEEDSPFTAADLEGTQSFAPVEFVAVACLISQIKDQTSLVRMKKRIKGLRQALRLEHKDLRLNAAVWKTAWKFIAKF